MSKKDTQQSYSKTNKEYARLYQCEIRTISRYKAQGLPLDDFDAMQEILNSQKNRPASKIDPEQAEEEDPNKISQAEAKRRKSIIEWQRMVFDFDVEKGKYVPVEKVIEAGYVLGSATAAALDKLRADLPSLLLGLDESGMSNVIASETNKIREQLADIQGRFYAKPA